MGYIAERKIDRWADPKKSSSSLSIRKSKSTTAKHATGSSRQVVDSFYNILSRIYDKHRLVPERIYNCQGVILVIPKM